MPPNEMTPVPENPVVPGGEERRDLVTHDEMVSMVRETLSDLDVVKKEALSSFYLFKDLLTNEGEGSSATKEQMASMLQIYLNTAETRIKTLDILIRSKKVPSGKTVTPGQTNINIMGGLTRREILEEIEKVVSATPTTDPLEIKVEPVEVQEVEKASNGSVNS